MLRISSCPAEEYNLLHAEFKTALYCVPRNA